MSGTEIERIEHPSGGAVVRMARGPLVNERTDGWIRVIQDVAELAAQVAGTEFVGKSIRDKPAAITAAILTGRELDMPPMQALANIDVIDGHPSMRAEHMRAMVFAAGHEITYPTLGGAQVVARGRRRYPDGTWSDPTSVEWNMRMAEFAKLTGKDNWRKYPRAMLTARATAELCRLVFPDVTHGLLATEEVEDGEQVPEIGNGAGGGSDAPPAKVSRARTRGKTGDAASPPIPPRVGQGPTAPPRPSLPVVGEARAVADDPMPSTPSEPTSEPRHCPDYASSHDRHTWAENDGTVWECSGLANQRLAEMHAEQNLAGEEAVAYLNQPEEGGPVADRPEGIRPGQKRALEAAFGSLHIEDRAERHHAASAILGRRITTFRPFTEDPSGLTKDDGSKLIDTIGKIENREQLEQIIQDAAENWGGE